MEKGKRGGKAKRNRYNTGASFKTLVDGLDYSLCILEHSCQTDLKIPMSGSLCRVRLGDFSCQTITISGP